MHLSDDPFLRTFGEAPVINDWRWRISIIAFLVIPFLGILKFAEHWQIRSSERKTEVSELRSLVRKELGQFQISGFVSEEVDVVQTYSQEYALLICGHEELPTGVAVVLQRAKSESDSLTEQLSSGSVDGLASSKQWMSSERAIELGLPVPAWAPERLLYVDVDKEYLSAIAGITAGYVVLGSVVLFVIYMKLDDSQTSLQNRRSKVNAQVALQLAIARHETYVR